MALRATARRVYSSGLGRTDTNTPLPSWRGFNFTNPSAVARPLSCVKFTRDERVFIIVPPQSFNVRDGNTVV
jgi:hypothetical protein